MTLTTASQEDLFEASPFDGTKNCFLISDTADKSYWWEGEERTQTSHESKRKKKREGTTAEKTLKLARIRIANVADEEASLGFGTGFKVGTAEMVKDVTS